MTQFPEEIDRDKTKPWLRLFGLEDKHVIFLNWAYRNPEAAKALVEGKAAVIEAYILDHEGSKIPLSKAIYGTEIFPTAYTNNISHVRLDRPEGDGK